jgi:PAS domain S-box-containing protein
MAEGVIVADERGKLLLSNPAAERLLGCGLMSATPEEWPERYGLYRPDALTPFPADELPLIRAIRDEESSDVLAFTRNANVPGGAFLSFSGRPMRDAEGVLRGGVVVFRDVTERRRAEEELRTYADTVRGHYNNAPCGYHSLDWDGTFLLINDTELSWLGYERDEVVGKMKFNEIITAESRKVFRDIFPVFVERGWVRDLEFEMVRKDGTILPALLNATAVKDAAGRFVMSQSTVFDITERKRVERRLVAQHAVTCVLAESSSSAEAIPKVLEAICDGLGWAFAALWRVDARANVLRCIETWHRPSVELAEFELLTRRITFAPGIGLPGRVWASGQPDWIRDVTQDANFPRAPIAAREGLHGAFGFPILLKGDVLGVIEFFSDEIRPPDDDLLRMMASIGSQIGQFIERQQMHARVVQSEKLASLGLLSAGVAHEINNPLAYVANNLAVLGRDVRGLKGLVAAYEEALATAEPARAEKVADIARLAEEVDLTYIRENIERILESTRQGIKRVADIVQNLRSFARLDQATLDRVNLHDAILGSLELIRGRLSRRQIAVEQQFGELPPVLCAPAQMNQVFLNLLVNAMQAVEATGRGDGRIEIRTRAAAGEVVVEVADNGCGIPPEVLPRIFDPFFTTKVLGEGTGLGMSISHGIVADHGGRIEVESTPGQGACFRVIVPIGGKGKARDERTAQRGSDSNGA